MKAVFPLILVGFWQVFFDSALTKKYVRLLFSNSMAQLSLEKRSFGLD